jgi:hypothetical protein
MKLRYFLAIVLLGVFGVSFVTLANYVESTGKVKGKVKIYDKTKKYTRKGVRKAKVRLYKKNGKRVDSKKSKKSGRYKFKDVKKGRYFMRCSAKGYVNAKKPTRTKYKTGKFKVKGGKTTKKNCRLMKIQ